MGLLTLEHSRGAYLADFVLYASAVVLLGAFLLLAAPPAQAAGIAALALVGLGGWFAIEYALHRYVLHGLAPFDRWHARHHREPTALICTPTIVSATLIATTVFLPALLLGNPWGACGLTLGVLTGYLIYATTHHAIHHWRSDNPWLKRRKRWHTLHHHGAGPARCYGVTTGFCDRLFGSEPRPRGAGTAAT